MMITPLDFSFRCRHSLQPSGFHRFVVSSEDPYKLLELLDWCNQILDENWLGHAGISGPCLILTRTFYVFDIRGDSNALLFKLAWLST